MYRRDDPRLQRRINQISQSAQSASEAAQVNIYTFSQNYVNPCLSSIGQAFAACTEPCFPPRDERMRRSRGRSRGRAELNFDFYDDWDDDEDLGWGNDELDRLLAGPDTGGRQPGQQSGMSYGTRTRRRSIGQAGNDDEDPNVIPGSSVLGFIHKLPWNIGRGRELRYKPSAADLQEHPGQRRADVEEQPLIEESEEEQEYFSPRKHKRKRSDTINSRQTTDSLSSRGDLFPSEDEDDAVPLDDEFAMRLERRVTGLGDDVSSGKARSKRPSASRASLRTASSRSTRSHGGKGETSKDNTELAVGEIPTLSELKQEEEMAQKEEEAQVERKREAAKRLAAKRGLSSDTSVSSSSEPKEESLGMISPPAVSQISSVLASPSSETTPFPPFDTRDDVARPGSKQLSPRTSKPPSEHSQNDGFVPAQLPFFNGQPG